jgi:hypothetical protein
MEKAELVHIAARLLAMFQCSLPVLFAAQAARKCCIWNGTNSSGETKQKARIMSLKSIAIISKDNSPKPLYNEIIKRGAGNMAKTQDMKLYYVVLLAFKKARLQGYGKEESFLQAKAALIDYFVSAPNISKQTFVNIWEATKQKEFTQQLNLDYELIKKQKETALLSRG